MSLAEDEAEADEMLIKRVQRGLSAFEIVYRPHPSWPNPNTRDIPNDSESSQPSIPRPAIAILDSSFNPPTRAHLALARSPAPVGLSYVSRLLLLSVRNVDKTLASSDATFAQRLQMMRLLASENGHDDTAVGIVDAPTFAAKASILRAAVKQSGEEAAAARLVFLQGIDTLERFLAERYYGTPESMRMVLKQFFALDGDDASIVCARRVMRTDASTDGDKYKKEHAMLALAAEIAAEERVHLLDIGDELQTFSSSEVRAKLRGGDGSWRNLVTEKVANYILEHNLYAPCG